MADKIKLILAVLVVAGAVFGYYYFADQSALLRVLGLLAALGIASAIAVRTEVGASTWAFGRGAMIEARKVVWPTRKETVQTTAMVMVMVLVVGIIIWVFDWVLASAVRFLTGQGG